LEGIVSRKLGSKLESTLREAVIQPGMPDKPDNLSDRASVQWDRLIDEMERSGIVLIPAYRAALVQAATLMADLAVAWEIIKRDGRYTTSRTGVMKTHPAVDDTMRLNEKLSRALWQLGLTPRAQRKPTAEAESDESTLEDVLDGDGTPGSAKKALSH
jgi:P27 family predicted phage terminase small subunit